MTSYFVYILISKIDKKLYVGCTSNLEERIKRHNKGFVFASKRRRPLVLIYFEEFQDKDTSFIRERFLKSLWSSRFKKKLKTEYINKVARQKFLD